MLRRLMRDIGFQGGLDVRGGVSKRYLRGSCKNQVKTILLFSDLANKELNSQVAKNEETGKYNARHSFF